LNRITSQEFGDKTRGEALALVQVLIVVANRTIKIGASWEGEFLEKIVTVLKSHPVS
jgi:hypothetical protein